MSDRMKKWLKRVFILVLLIIIFIQLKGILIEGIHEMQKIDWLKKLGIITASTVYTLIEGTILYQMVKSYQVHLTVKQGVAGAYYSAFFRLATFGSGAAISEIYYLSKHGMQPGHATGMSMIKYLMHKIVVGLFGGISFLLYYENVNRYIGKYNKYILFALIVTVIIGAVIMLLALSKRCAELIMKLLDYAQGKKSSLKEKIDKLKNQIILLQSGTAKLCEDKKRLAKILLLNFCKFICWYSIPYILYGDNTDLTFVMSIAFMALANMIAGVIPVPSGYGALDFCMAMLFEPIVGLKSVVAMTILYRIATSIIPFFVGAIVTWKIGYNHKKE